MTYITEGKTRLPKNKIRQMARMIEELELTQVINK